MAIAREIAGKDRIGRIMGVLGTMSAFGTALGPPLGGGLIAIAGWRAIFFSMLPVTVFALLLVMITLPKMIVAKRPSIRNPTRFSDRRLVIGLLTNLLVAAVMMTTLLVGPFYLGLSLGLNEALVGLIMSIGPLISIISGVPSGRLVDSRGVQSVTMFGLILLTTGSLALTVLPVLLGTPGYILAIAILTPGYQLFQAANNTAIMIAAPAEARGVVSGLFGLSRNLGLIFGASVMGAIFAFGVGTSEFSDASSHAITSGMQLAFLVSGAMMLFSLLITKRSCAN